MYNSTFKNLVFQAHEKSKEFFEPNYPDRQAKNNSPNPYYVGYGNPNSKILILGMEKAFDYEKQQGQLFYESIANPDDWKRIIENNISDIYVKYDEQTSNYKNALHPYSDKKPKGGSTYNKYQKLVSKVVNENDSNIINSFFLNSFISEVNYSPSKKTKNPSHFGNRMEFLNHPFYKSFPITILACGNYLKRNEIEKLFDVSYVSDSYSEKNNKLIIYKKGNRLLMNTRQLSGGISNEYLQQISELAKSNNP
jgi:hypothetical protein